MAFTKSGLYTHTFREILRATTLTGGQIDLRLATYKIALLGAATDASSPVAFDTATVSWVNTNEVSGTGWAAGGLALSAVATGSSSAVPTCDVGTAGSLRYDHTNDLSVAGTTLASVQGCIIYADPVTSPADMADAMIVCVCFGASYSTTSGIFAVTWSGTGIFELDLTP